MIRTSAVKKFKVEFGGKERALSYTFRAYAKFAEKTGIELPEFARELGIAISSEDPEKSVKLNASHLVSMVWAGLTDDELTWDEVADNLDTRVFFSELLPIIVEGLTVESGEADPPKRPTKSRKSSG